MWGTMGDHVLLKETPRIEACYISCVSVCCCGNVLKRYGRWKNMRHSVGDFLLHFEIGVSILVQFGGTCITGTGRPSVSLPRMECLPGSLPVTTAVFGVVSPVLRLVFQRGFNLIWL